MHPSEAAARDWLWSQLQLMGQVGGDWGSTLLPGVLFTLLCAAVAGVGWAMRKLPR